MEWLAGRRIGGHVNFEASDIFETENVYSMAETAGCDASHNHGRQVVTVIGSGIQEMRSAQSLND